MQYKLKLGDKFETTLSHDFYRLLVRYFHPRGIRAIYGLTGEQSQPLLDKCQQKLTDDYEILMKSVCDNHRNQIHVLICTIVIMACRSIIHKNEIWSDE